MNALILCDGSEGSLRCVEVACAAPGRPSNTDASLVLLHVWGPPKPHTSAIAAGTGEEARSHRLSAAGPAAPTGLETTSAAPDQNIPSAAAAAASVGGHGTPSRPCGEVLTATLKAIHTNKYIKSRVHYTLETMSVAAVHDRVIGLKEELRKPTAAPVATNKTNTASGGLASSDAVAVDAMNVRESDNDETVNAVVRHVRSRAAHHCVDAILLGVGQQQEGKQCRVGGTALNTLQHLRTLYPLYFIKKDGAKWRPVPTGTATALPTSTAASTSTSVPLRFTIVVPLPVLEPLTPSSASAPQEKIKVKALPPTVRTAAEAAVRYVQQHCVRTLSLNTAASAPLTVDSIAFFLIAPSVFSSEDIGDTSAAAAAAVPVNQAALGLEGYKQCFESLLPTLEVSSSSSSPSSAPAQSAEEASAATASAAGEEEAHKPTAEAATSLAAAASRVTVCALKPTKKHPLVTLAQLDVALPQVMKHVSALKPDVLVLPASLVPEALQLAMLSASKPHCVVLPC